ncbi:MAG: hypothetical protein WCG91_00450 [Candidatus Shapirobacteria bacterium]
MFWSKTRHNYQFLLILGLFIITRISSLGIFPHFYDSPEYVKLAQLRQPLEAIRQSHESLHPLYIWSIQLAYYLKPNIVAISSVSFIFGLITFFGLAYFLKNNFGKIITRKALLIFTLFPATFLLHTQIMHESLEHALLIWGIVALTEFFKRHRFYLFFSSILLFSLAISNYIGIIFWFPLCFAVVWWIQKKWNKSDLILLGINFISSIVIGYLAITALMFFTNIKLDNRFGFFTQQIIPLLDILTPIGFLRGLRNIIYVLFYGYGVLAPLVFLIAIIKTVFIKNWRNTIILSIGFICLIVSNYFWHGGMYGRLAGVVALFLAILIAFIKTKWIYILVCISTAFSLLVTFIVYHQEPIPIKQLNIIKQVINSDNDFIVISDYQRPQLEINNKIVVGSATYQQAQTQIKQAIDSNQHVYITSQAITFPYEQYDGQTKHILSNGPIQKSHLYSFLSAYSLHKVIEDSNYPLLNLYEVKK